MYVTKKTERWWVVVCTERWWVVACMLQRRQRGGELWYVCYKFLDKNITASP